AVPHVREPQALVVAGEDPLPVGRCDQLERRLEPVVGVRQRALRGLQRERRARVVNRFERRARGLEHGAGVLVAARGDDVVEEAGEVPGAQGLRRSGRLRASRPAAMRISGEIANMPAMLRRTSASWTAGSVSRSARSANAIASSLLPAMCNAIAVVPTISP